MPNNLNTITIMSKGQLFFIFSRLSWIVADSFPFHHKVYYGCNTQTGGHFKYKITSRFSGLLNINQYFAFIINFVKIISGARIIFWFIVQWIYGWNKSWCGIYDWLSATNTTWVQILLIDKVNYIVATLFKL